MTGMERPEPVDVEICPECGGTNIGGRKNCYGPPDAKHDPVRFEFRQFLPASYADRLEQRVRTLHHIARSEELPPTSERTE